MSQITTTADLILGNEAFLSSLAQTEAATRAWASRMNSIRVDIPLTQQGQVDRAVGSLANDAMRRTGTPTAAMLEDAGGLRTRIAQLTELRNAVKSGGTGQQLLDSAIQGMESRLAKLAPAAAAATAQAVTQAGAAAETAITTAAGKLTEAVTKTTAGTTANVAAEEEVPASRGARGGALNQRLSRSALGGLIGYYGIQQLDQTIGELTELRQTNEIEDPVAQAKARADIARERNSGLMGALRRGVARATTPKGSSTPDLGEDTQAIYESSQQAVKDAEKGVEHAKLFDKGVEANEEMTVKLAETVNGAAAGHRAALAKWMKAQEKAAAALAETGNPQSGSEAKKMLAQAQEYVRAQNQAIENDARAQEDATRLDVRQTDRAGTAAAMETQGRLREAEVMQRQAAIRDRVEAARIAWLGENSDPVKKEDARQRYEAERDAAPVEQAAVTYDEDLYQRRQERQTEGTLSDLNARTRFNRIRAGGTVAAEHAATLAEQNDAAGSTVRQLQRQLDVEDEPKQQERLQRDVDAAKEDQTAQVAANNAREIRRVRESVSDFIIGKDRAELAEAEKDYTRQTKIFEDEWDKRIRATQTAEEKQAAIEQRGAERRARAAQHDRDIDLINRQGREAYTRAAGNPYLAENMEQLAQTREQLRIAGNDTVQRRAIAYRGRGQLQEEARGMIQPGIFGSQRDYLQSAQASVLSGRGSILRQMQQQYQALGRVQRSADQEQVIERRREAAESTLQRRYAQADRLGSTPAGAELRKRATAANVAELRSIDRAESRIGSNGDKELFGASTALEKAAEKLSKQNIFVLKD